MSWQRLARLGLAGAVLPLACGCGGRSASEAPIPPATGGATDGAPPSDAAGGDASDSAPPSDAAFLADDPAPACTTDAIFLVVSLAPDGGGSHVLEAFHPASGLLTTLGSLDCAPFPGDGEPINGLAVDRSGRFYVSLLRAIVPIDTTAGFACVKPWVNADSFNPQGSNGYLEPLGIAFVGQPDGDTLYGSFLDSVVASQAPPPSLNSLNVIGTIDTHSGAVNVVRGDAGAPTGNLTGTGDGRLFVSGTSTIVEVDPTTGASMQTLPIAPSLQSIGLFLALEFPLAFWAGDFFVFPTTGASDVATGLPLSAVVRFHPSDNSSAVVGQLDGIVLGAAVSTCAPLH